mmetsp:Transcript_32659/g.68982  ORF Transcript_32659/g.68982 Transcript_32659/m.68982 type:complete len:226 (-) Transcript_32659:1487-2164(-)
MVERNNSIVASMDDINRTCEIPHPIKIWKQISNGCKSKIQYDAYHAQKWRVKYHTSRRVRRRRCLTLVPITATTRLCRLTTFHGTHLISNTTASIILHIFPTSLLSPKAQFLCQPACWAASYRLAVEDDMFGQHSFHLCEVVIRAANVGITTCFGGRRSVPGIARKELLTFELTLFLAARGTSAGDAAASDAVSSSSISSGSIRSWYGRPFGSCSLCNIIRLVGR